LLDALLRSEELLCTVELSKTPVFFGNVGKVLVSSKENLLGSCSSTRSRHEGRRSTLASSSFRGTAVVAGTLVGVVVVVVVVVVLVYKNNEKCK
jgi:hypothetical protein